MSNNAKIIKSQYNLKIKYVTNVAVKNEVFEIHQQINKKGNHACHQNKLNAS